MRRIWLACIGVSLVSITATWWLWQVFLEPSARAAESVSFDTLSADLESGDSVTEIRIRNRSYTYRVLAKESQKSITKRATGPEPTLDSVKKLRPSKPDGFVPKIYFEE